MNPPTDPNHNQTASVVIRPYRPADQPTVAELWRAGGLIVPCRCPDRDRAPILQVEADWFLVAELRGRGVATCVAGRNGRHGWINYIAVEAPYRGRGLGARMTQEAENRLRDAGCETVELQVQLEKPGLAAFYERLGFVRRDALTFCKRITPS